LKFAYFTRDPVIFTYLYFFYIFFACIYNIIFQTNLVSFLTWNSIINHLLNLDLEIVNSTSENIHENNIINSESEDKTIVKTESKDKAANIAIDNTASERFTKEENAALEEMSRKMEIKRLEQQRDLLAAFSKHDASFSTEGLSPEDKDAYLENLRETRRQNTLAMLEIEKNIEALTVKDENPDVNQGESSKNSKRPVDSESKDNSSASKRKG